MCCCHSHVYPGQKIEDFLPAFCQETSLKRRFTLRKYLPNRRSHTLPVLFRNNVKLPALMGGASRKGKYLFQIASLNPASKGGACREANRSKVYRVKIQNAVYGCAMIHVVLYNNWIAVNKKPLPGQRNSS